MPAHAKDMLVARKNRLLAGLPRHDLEELLAESERCPLDRKQLLVEANEPIRAAYFPLSGAASLIMASTNGTTIEVAMVGCEGLIGLPLLLGSEITPISAVVQLPGEALRIGAPAFRQQIARNGPLVRRLHLFAQSLLDQVAQSTACIRHHSVAQRCARWLLTMHDHAESDEYVLTQDLLAQMLGVRRASVTAAAARLQREGAIRYRRGAVTIIDRAALERASCECYGLIRAEYERLLGGSAS
jgi:CRP-like cAMP-binding protein